MAIRKISPRLQLHNTTIAGATFGIPTATEDFTMALTQSAGYVWSPLDLANREIGVNTTDNKAYIRLGNNINQFKFVEAENVGEWQTLTTDTLSAGVSASLGITISTGRNYLIETLETTSSTFSKAIIHSTKNMLYYDGTNVLQSEVYNSGTSSLFVGDAVVTRNVWLVTATGANTANVAYNLEINGGEVTDYTTTLKYKIETTN